MPTTKMPTTNAGWVDTVAVPRARLRPGDRIVSGGVVYVTREPVRWELTAPQHWLWLRRLESPELTDQQLRDLGNEAGAFDGTGYGFLSNGPDHVYDLVVDPADFGL